MRSKFGGSLTERRIVLHTALAVALIWQGISLTNRCAAQSDGPITVAAIPHTGDTLVPLPKVAPPSYDAALADWQEPVQLPYASVASVLTTSYPGQQVPSLTPTELTVMSQQPLEGAGDENAADQMPAEDQSPFADDAPAADQVPAAVQAPAANPAEPKTLGKAPPPNNNNLEFLRRQTVLLKPGQWQFDAGLTYTMFENTFPIALVDNANQVVGVVQGRARQRLATIPFELRYGLTSKIQAFCALPVGWANSGISFPGSEIHDDIGGLADLRAGASFLVRQGCGCDPDQVATIAMTAPTGDPGPFSIGLAPGARLGEGYWGIAANVLWIHTLDPIIVYYGVGYKHRFDAELSGLQVNPGEEFNLQLGVGFAVNPNVTLSSSFLGAYISKYKANSVQLAGSELEIVRQRFSVTIARGSKIVEPFAEIGMTQDSPGTRCGVVWTF